jgi:hypothetical protein
MTVTLLELRTGARQRADQENSDFVTDAELDTYINSEIAELKDLLIGAYDSDYDVQTVSFSTTANTASYALPNGTNYSAAPAFYKLRGVDVKLDGTNWLSLQPFNFNERNKNLDSGWGISADLRYRLVGSNIMFTPVPSDAHEVKLWYIPVATKLSADSDTLSDLNQYSEYVMVGAALKMIVKEEGDASALASLKLDLRTRIVNMAQNRDAGQPESVSDIYDENPDYYFRR